MNDYEIKDGCTPLFDTHAHYDDEMFDIDREYVLENLKNNGIGFVTTVGCSFESMETSSLLAQKYDFMYASAGLHPDEAEKAEENPDTEKILRYWLEQPKNVALGEIGLDYHGENRNKELQKKWFEIQLDLAEELNKPVIIHDREAHGDIMEIVTKHKNVKGVFHSFSGSWEMAKELVKMGWYISFSGVLTFKNAAKLPEVAEKIRSDRMLVETDSPYLAPVPMRGRRNDSTLMRHTASKLAQIRNISYEEVCKITTENAKRFYRL